MKGRGKNRRTYATCTRIVVEGGERKTEKIQKKEEDAENVEKREREGSDGGYWPI